MKGVRFYEEFTNKRKGESAGNVTAILPENRWHDWEAHDLMYDGVGAVYFYPNSPVASTGVSRGYLREKCKRVSEARARQVHPALFTTWLDRD
jgi:hypothetical protein